MTVDPPISPTSEEFWEGTRQRRLILQWCGSCETPIHHPRTQCPRCRGSELVWRDHHGRGRVYSWADHPGADQGPRMVAMVELDDGPRLLTWILGNTDDIGIDRPVRLRWHPLDDGRALPCFELTTGATT